MYVLSLAVMFAAQPPAAGIDEALKAALKKTTAVSSYGFRVNEGPSRKLVLQGEFQAGRPVYYHGENNIPVYRQGAVLAYQDKDGTWHKSKTGTTSDPLRVLGAIARVRQTVLPHEELVGFDKRFKDVKKVPGSDEYQGALTLEGARELLLPSDRTLAKRGTATIQLGADGLIRLYHVSIDIEGRRGNAEVKGTVVRSVTIENVGKVEIKVPEGAKKALE